MCEQTSQIERAGVAIAVDIGRARTAALRDALTIIADRAFGALDGLMVAPVDWITPVDGAGVTVIAGFRRTDTVAAVVTSIALRTGVAVIAGLARRTRVGHGAYVVCLVRFLMDIVGVENNGV